MPEPKVRFKKDDGSSYPEWGTSSFSKTFNALNNNTYSRDMLNYDGGDAKNIHYGDILVKFGDICDIQKNNIPYVNEGLAIQKYGYLKDGDIILADTAEDETVGKAIEIYNIKNDIVISGLHTMAWRPVESFASKYLGHYLNSPAFHNQLKPYMQGVKVTSIGRANIAKVGVSFPESLEEQQKIADFLSSVDDVISASEEEVENLEKQKKAVMKKIFSQEVRFKRADGTDFPEWEEVTVGDVTAFHKQGYYTNEEYVSDGYKIARVSDLYSPVVVYDDMPMVPMTDKDYQAFKIETGDFLIARSGSIGRYGIVYDIPEDSRVVFGSFVIKFQFDVEKITNEYFGQYYSSTFAEKSLKTITQTGANVNINAENIKSMKMLLPCLEEQRLIADFLSSFDEAITTAKKELELWKELKKALLQQMFV